MGDEYSHPISGASCRSRRFVWLSSRRQREIGTVTDSIQSVSLTAFLTPFSMILHSMHPSLYLPFSDFASIKRWVCIHIFHHIISFPCTHINPNIRMANSYDSLLTWRSNNTAPPKEFIRCRKASPFKLLFFVYFRSTLMDSCVIFLLEGTLSSSFLSSFF